MTKRIALIDAYISKHATKAKYRGSEIIWASWLSVSISALMLLAYFKVHVCFYFVYALLQVFVFSLILAKWVAYKCHLSNVTIMREVREDVLKTPSVSVPPQLVTSLKDMIQVAKGDNWQGATTGRQIILREAVKAVEKLEGNTGNTNGGNHE